MHKLGYVNRDLPYRGQSPTPDLRVMGISGTYLQSGYISGKEQNHRLTGSAWVREAEEMLATDASVAASWRVLKQTLLEAKWRWEPGDESDELSKRLCEYANEAFGFDGYPGQITIPWEDQLAYMWEFAPIGYRYFEELYRVAPCASGQMRVWLDRFADREPSAHLRWESADGQNLDAVLQATRGNRQPLPIPADKLLLLTLNQTGSNFEGRGLLRPAWWWWRFKQRTSNLIGVGVERWAVATPRISVNRAMAEEMGLTDHDIDTMIDRAAAQAQAYVAQEQSYLVDNPVVSFQTYGEQKLDSTHALSIIRECDNQIAQSFLAQFLHLGITDTGARSVGEVHLSVFRRSALNLCDMVASRVGGVDRRAAGTIGRLIRWNFGEVNPAQLPVLKHSGLDADELAESLSSLSTLVQFGLLTPEDDLERSIRQRIGAGELPDEASRSFFDRISATAPAGGGGLALAERYRKLMKGAGK